LLARNPTADTGDGSTVAVAQLLKGDLISRSDSAQQLGVTCAVLRRSERLGCHGRAGTFYMCILPLAMFGRPFGLMISHRPPCMLACWHMILPTLSAE